MNIDQSIPHDDHDVKGDTNEANISIGQTIHVKHSHELIVWSKGYKFMPKSGGQGGGYFIRSLTQVFHHPKSWHDKTIKFHNVVQKIKMHLNRSLGISPKLHSITIHQQTTMPFELRFEMGLTNIDESQTIDRITPMQPIRCVVFIDQLQLSMSCICAFDGCYFNFDAFFNTGTFPIH